MSAQLKAIQEPIELLHQRTMHGKTFILPDGRIKVSSCVRPYHWDDNGVWVDVDETPRSEDGEVWMTRSTPYEMTWDTERLELHFKSKYGGESIIRLVALDDGPVPRPTTRAIQRNHSVNIFVTPDLEIEMRCRTHNVEIFKILHGPTAPRKLTWEVTEVEPGLSMRLMETTGRDNLLNAQSRKKEHQLNRRRRIELLHTRTEVSPDIYRVTEEFTGRTRFIDPKTRARSWKREVEWPVEIDVTVSVSVTADLDDGRGYSPAYWKANGIVTQGYGTVLAGAFRFLSVNVPQGQTLDSATLTLKQTLHNGSQSATLSGQNVDSAEEWADTSANSPLVGMAATTANVSVAPAVTNGIVNITVTGPVQEIVNRAGFVANNNIRLGFTNVAGMTASYMRHEDFSAAAGNPAKLDIIYTPAGGGGTPSRSRLVYVMP